MANSPEIDCNCPSYDLLVEDKKYEINGRLICKHCRRVYRMVPNGPDDFEYEEIVE